MDLASSGPRDGRHIFGHVGCGGATPGRRLGAILRSWPRNPARECGSRSEAVLLVAPGELGPGITEPQAGHGAESALRDRAGHRQGGSNSMVADDALTRTGGAGAAPSRRRASACGDGAGCGAGGSGCPVGADRVGPADGAEAPAASGAVRGGAPAGCGCGAGRCYGAGLAAVEAVSVAGHRWGRRPHVVALPSRTSYPLCGFLASLVFSASGTKRPPARPANTGLTTSRSRGTPFLLARAVAVQLAAARSNSE